MRIGRVPIQVASFLLLDGVGKEKKMASKQGNLAEVLDANTTLSWLMMLERGILTPETLERLWEWLREQVLRADREVNPATWHTDFDFYKPSGDSLINLCQAVSIGTKLYIERKVTKEMCEALFVKSQPGNEGIAEVDEETIIRICLKKLNDKLKEFAENAWLLPSEGLLTLR